LGAARHAYHLLTRLLAAVLALSVAALPAFAQPSAPAPVRVMVLPFQVHSARPLAYLEQSLADLLTTRLEGSGRVEVVEADAAAATYRGAQGSEPGLRQIASERGARFIVTGSLTELAGQYSLDLRVTPAAGGAGSTLDASASGDDQLLDRIGDLAAQIAEVVGGRAARPRIASVRVIGAPDEAAASAALATRTGEPFDGEIARADAAKLEALPGIATAAVESTQSERGIDVVFRVVESARILPGGEAGADGARIAEVRVRGNRRIEEAAIRARVASAVGGALNAARLAQDVREIYALGFFKNVRVLQQHTPAGVAITFAVEENPIVRQVSVTGNDEVESDKIKDNLTLTTGSTLDYPLLTENVQRIQQLYRAEGFYLADVKFEVEQLPADAVAVNFVVEEGEKSKLRKISFIGNKAFSDEELMEEFKTKEWRWYTILWTYFDKSGRYSEPLFAQDLKSVSEKYLDHGYIQAEVADPEVEATKKGLIVKIRIVEGDQYKVGAIDMQGDETLDKELLRQALTLKQGDVFSRSALDTDRERLEHNYSDRGFFNAKVDPQTRVHPDEKTVDVAYSIGKGSLSFLREIEVTGNKTTIDPVVRREMMIVEGELYSAAAVDVSKARLERLGFFEEVEIAPINTDYADQMDLGVKVVEKPTGSLSFGAGYSSRDGFIVSGSVSQSNLFGRGYNGSIVADVGGRTNRFFVTLGDPYFLGSDWGLSAQLFRTALDYPGFDLDQYGGELVTSHFLNENGTARAFVRYSFANREIKRGGIFGNRIQDAAAVIQREVEAKSQTTSLAGLSVRYDTRNDRITPTAGKVADLGLDYAGLGGFSQFARVEGSAAFYARNPRWLPDWLPSAERGVWVVGGRAGLAYPLNTLGDFDLAAVNPLGDGTDVGVADISPEVRSLQYIDRNLELPLSERYFVGGIGQYQLRGFKARDVGPRRAELVPVVRRESNPGQADAYSIEENLYRPRGTRVDLATGVVRCADSPPSGGDPFGADYAEAGFGNGNGRCNSIYDRKLSDFDDLKETDIIGGNKFFTTTVEYRFPISEEFGLIGITFVDAGNAFAEDEDMWDVGLWRFGAGAGVLWFSPFGPLQLFLGFPLDKTVVDKSMVFEFSVGGQGF
jgi:outer membrane protein insertion porin family